MKRIEVAGTVSIDINLCPLKWSLVKRQVLLVSLLIFVYYSETAGTVSTVINLCIY